MEDEDEEELHCLGRRCFKLPHEGYVLPSFYPIPLLRGEKVPGRDYRWKVAVQLREGALRGAKSCLLPRLSLLRGFSLPQILGLGDDGRWRWQGLPLALLIGCKLDWPSPSAQGTSGSQLAGWRPSAVRPAARLKVLTPVFGKLALRASLELMPLPALSLKRVLRLGRSTKLSVLARLQAGEGGAQGGRPRWSLQLHWHPADSLRAWRLPAGDAEGSTRLEYSRSLPVTRDCKLEVATAVDVAEGEWQQAGRRTAGSLRLQRLKLTQIIGTQGRRDPPRRTSTYLRAAHAIGKTGVIAVVPGHWIDPGGEPGAPGEREFNLEVADAVEGQLRGGGWEVLRPDRDAPALRWEEYLNWVSRQTLRGSPVLEVHGQGSKADFRGYVLGVIGDHEAPLNKELARRFGMFPMGWRELAVPRRGGVLLECFNSDEVVRMAPWHRTWAVKELARQISGCIERASAPNRGHAAAAASSVGTTGYSPRQDRPTGAQRLEERLQSSRGAWVWRPPGVPTKG